MASNQPLSVLKSRSDFQYLFKNGQRFYPSHWLVVNVCSTKSGGMRFGWTLPKFVGTAVTRNRLKRWCREYLRKKALKDEKSLDINFVFKRTNKDFYKNLNYEELDKTFNRFFRKLSK